MSVLPDLLKPGLSVVFCGTAPSLKSAEEKAYYAKPGNKFWPTLHEVGLTPRRLEPREYPSLLNYGLGLTDLVKDQFGQDSALNFEETSRSVLLEKLLKHAPKIVAFTSLRAVKESLGVSMKYGLQDARVGQSRVFVLPSPSGLASGYWDIAFWRELAWLSHQPRI